MLYKRGKIWYYDFTINDERYRESTRTSDRKEAQLIEEQARTAARKRNTSGHTTLAEVLRIWLTERERSDREKGAIRRLLEGYPSRPLVEVDAFKLRESIRGQPATINRTISILNAAYGLARARGIPTPANIPKLRVDTKKMRFLSAQEWERLDAELSGHVRDICRFAVYTGLRSANVLNLKWSEVNLEKKMVWVDASAAKGKKAIGVPLSGKAVSLLLSLAVQKESDWVFTYKGKPVKSIKTSFNKALIRAGINDFTFHDLRHTWASWKVQAGTPLMVVKELGGWADISMVQRYSHLSPDHLRQWVD